MENLLTLTESAAAKLKEIAKENKKEGHGLKIDVIEGGCCGVSYGMDFQEKASPGDTVEVHHGMKVFLSKDTASQVKGAKIDVDPEGVFRIENKENPSCKSCHGGCK
ncbi:MAG: iron-sulfur cluster assembly accessory protein [Nanoarchaeota archaeon]|nr:iron-sulfur cluster assembly accessory protein [Nanoarchaeota archaeon]